MAATAEWSIPFSLQTPYATVTFNDLVSIGSSPVGYFVLDPTACDSGASLRVVRDDEPQLSGEIVHNHYKQGYEMKLKCSLWETIGDNAVPACGEVLVALLDFLQGALQSILGDDPFLAADGRMVWTPTGAPHNRMLDRCRLLEKPTIAVEMPIALTTVEFAIVTPFPYVLTEPEGDGAGPTFIPDTTPTVITNSGNSSTWPVVKVWGPTTFFQLFNSSYLDLNGNPSQVAYDSALPGAAAVGAGDYIEFGFFRNTAYLNGNGANMKPGINLQDSDFWPLVAGDNTIEIFGATAYVLWNSAWS